MNKLILAIALTILVLATVFITGCSTQNPYNPFVCSTEPRDELMLNSIQAQKINPDAIAEGVNLGTVKASPTTFAVSADFINLVNLAMNKVDDEHVLVVYTDIDACNQIQYLYAKFIFTQLITHGFSGNKMIFVDAKTNEMFKADKEASLNFAFVIVDKHKL